MFSYDNFIEESSWIFNWQHLGLIGFVLIAIIVLLVSLNASTQRGIDNTKIGLGLTLIVLELSRICYEIGFQNFQGLSINAEFLVEVFSFKFCTVMTWFTAFTLLLSANHKNKFVEYCCNILFGCAMVGAIVAFVYPSFIEVNRPIYHFLNLQSILVHILLITTPLYLIMNNQLNIYAKNLWMPIIGFIIAGSVAITAMEVTSYDLFAYGNYIEAFNLLEIKAGFPWNLMLIFLGVYSITVFLYLLFGFWKKDTSKPIPEYHIWIRAMVILLGVFGLCLMPLLLGATEENPSIQSWNGLCCLIPAVFVSISLIHESRALTRIQNKPLNNK